MWTTFPQIVLDSCNYYEDIVKYKDPLQFKGILYQERGESTFQLFKHHYLSFNDKIPNSRNFVLDSDMKGWFWAKVSMKEDNGRSLSLLLIEAADGPGDRNILMHKGIYLVRDENSWRYEN